jgi:hypothetical protein
VALVVEGARCKAYLACASLNKRYQQIAVMSGIIERLHSACVFASRSQRGSGREARYGSKRNFEAEKTSSLCPPSHRVSPSSPALLPPRYRQLSVTDSSAQGRSTNGPKEKKAGRSSKACSHLGGTGGITDPTWSRFHPSTSPVFPNRLPRMFLAQEQKRSTSVKHARDAQYGTFREIR